MNAMRYGTTEIAFTSAEPGEQFISRESRQGAMSNVHSLKLHPSDAVRAAAARLPAGWIGLLTLTDGRHSAGCIKCKHWKPVTLAVGVACIGTFAAGPQLLDTYTEYVFAQQGAFA